MVNALKKMNKKFLVLLLGIVLLPIFIIIFLAIIQSCDIKIEHKEYEEKMIKAALKYIKDEKLEPKKESEMINIDLDDLTNKEYIKSSEDLLGDDTCKGNVYIRRNGVSIEETEGGYLNSLAVLKCDKYETKTLLSEVMKEETSDDSGLYKKDNYYVFKGDFPKNFVNYNGQLYVISNIDQNGIIKLIKIESESLDQYWDLKYNIEIEDLVGKNLYEDSNISKILDEYYISLKEKEKDSLIFYDICVGYRDINNLSMDSAVDCSTKLEKKAVSLMNVTDFANASLDVDCKDILSKSCRNYNYLRQFGLSTWTLNAVSNNTYEVYYLQNGVINYQQASKYHEYNIVIYLDGNEKVSLGSGTEKDPFVIE